MTLSLPSAEETLDIFLNLWQTFLSKKISVDKFSSMSNALWQRAEKQTGGQNDILWSELADVLLVAADLSWYSRSAVEGYPMIFQQVQSFIASHKKIGKNQRNTTT